MEKHELIKTAIVALETPFMHNPKSRHAFVNGASNIIDIGIKMTKQMNLDVMQNIFKYLVLIWKIGYYQQYLD